MMGPWLQVYSNLITHPKTYALADALKLTCAATTPNVVAAGMLVSLWSWALNNAMSGDVSACPARAIADAAGWRKKPDTLLEALVSCRWIDRDGNTLTLHDWEDYASLVMEQEDNRKRKTKERVQRYREKKKRIQLPDVTPDGNVDSEECNGDSNVTVTPSNASTVPNITRPDHIAAKAAAATRAQGDEEQAGIAPYPLEAKQLCQYFEQNCHRLSSQALLNAVTTSIEAGVEAPVVQAVIDDTALAAPDKPAAYVVRILATLREERVYTVAAYAARKAQREAQQKRGRNTPPAGEMPPDAPLADWEQEWLKEVKAKRGQHE